MSPRPAVPCRAKSPRTGEACRAYAMVGGVVCSAHGGRAKQVRASAARRLAQQRASRELGRLLGELELEAADAHPIEALTNALARAKAMVEVLGDLVGGLGAESGEPGARIYGPDHLGDGRPHVLVTMYESLARQARQDQQAGARLRHR